MSFPGTRVDNTLYVTSSGVEVGKTLGAANGIPTLDGTGKVPSGQLPASASGTRVSVPIAGSGVFTLDSTQSAASVLELTGILTGDRTVDFIVTDGRQTVIVNNTTGTFYVFVRAASGSVKLHAPRGRALPIYCGAAELSNAAKPSRVYIGTGTQPYYWWRCDEPAGSTALVSSGTGGANNLTVTLANTRQEIGSFLRGADTSHRVFGTPRSVPGVASAHAAVNSFMFGGWFRVAADGILMSYGTDHNLTMTAGLASMSVLRAAGAANVTADASMATTLGDYHHYMAGYDNSVGGVRLYVDGQVAGSSPGISNVTYTVGNAWTIGAAAGFKGVCEDIRVYDFYDSNLPALIWAQGMDTL